MDAPSVVWCSMAIPPSGTGFWSTCLRWGAARPRCRTRRCRVDRTRPAHDTVSAVGTQIIYVQLLDNGIDVWRPVEATAGADGTFRLPDRLQKAKPGSSRQEELSGARGKCSRTARGSWRVSQWT